jgi:hypothetical protein
MGFCAFMKCRKIGPNSGIDSSAHKNAGKKVKPKSLGHLLSTGELGQLNSDRPGDTGKRTESPSEIAIERRHDRRKRCKNGPDTCP